ncbi:MAG: hypothetical protein ACR2NL_06225 [Acidimicrobiia bacterium]
MSRLTALLMMAVLLVTACSGDGASNDEAFGPDQLVAALQDQGVSTEAVDSPYGRADYLDQAARQQVLCLDGQEASLFVYDTLSAAESDAALIRPDGNPKNVAIDLLWGRLMWWAKGRVIVNYNFDDPAISGSLTETMGTSLSPQGDSFSQPPDPLPVSDACQGQS